MTTDTDVSSIPTTAAPTDAPTPITSSGHDGTSRASDEAVGWGWDSNNSMSCFLQPGSAGFQGRREEGEAEHRTMGYVLLFFFVKFLHYFVDFSTYLDCVLC